MTGIYKIENKINGKVYIGQSVNIEQRWREHKWALNKSDHRNSYLQRAWNKYGENSFIFEIIEECDIDNLDTREIYWIDYYNSFNRDYGYNRTLGGDGNRIFNADEVYAACELYNSQNLTSIEIGEILNLDSKAVRRRLHFGTAIGLCDYDPDKSSWIKVICLNNLKIYESIDIAEKENNVNGITGCCKHKHSYAGKDENGNPLVWMYYKEYLEIPEAEKSLYIKNIFDKIMAKYYVCLNTKEIFDTVDKAMNFAGIKSISSIQNCCLGKSNFSGKNKATKEKYVWRYYKDYINMTEDEINQIILSAQIYSFEKAVVCLNTMEKFDSVNIASDSCLINKDLIKMCCQGAHCIYLTPEHKYHLTVWVYEEDFNQMNEEEITKRLNKAKYHRTSVDRVKPLVCLNNLYVFEKQIDAGAWADLKNPSNIGHEIRKNGGIARCGTDKQTGEKYKWMYLEDYINKYGEDGLIRYQSA